MQIVEMTTATLPVRLIVLRPRSRETSILWGTKMVSSKGLCIAPMVLVMVPRLHLAMGRVILTMMLRLSLVIMILLSCLGWIVVRPLISLRLILMQGMPGNWSVHDLFSFKL